MDSTIHKNPDLSLIDKFNYLKALLDRPATGTIQGLVLSEENYLAVLGLVKEWYYKTKQVIATHMDVVIIKHLHVVDMEDEESVAPLELISCGRLVEGSEGVMCTAAVFNKYSTCQSYLLSV